MVLTVGSAGGAERRRDAVVYAHRYDPGQGLHPVQRLKRSGQNLPDRLNVKLFERAGPKAPFKQHAQFVRDLLNEYATYSGDKLNVEVIKIGEGDSKREEEASKYRCRSQTAAWSRPTSLRSVPRSSASAGLPRRDRVDPDHRAGGGAGVWRFSPTKQMTVKKKGRLRVERRGAAAHPPGVQILSEQLKSPAMRLTSVELKANIPPMWMRCSSSVPSSR